MLDLKKNEWLLRNNNSMFSEKTLQTPGILNDKSNTLQVQLSATMDAFHKATKEGFLLQDVNKAPLAQRRKRKKDSDERSGSSDSNNSGHTSLSHSQSLSGTASQSPLRDSPVRNFSNNSNHSNTSSASYSSTHSLGFVPQKSATSDLISSLKSASELSHQDLFLHSKDNDRTLSLSSQGAPVQEVRSSSSVESNSVTDCQPFQNSRGVKRKHSLEFESCDNDDNGSDSESEKSDSYDEEYDDFEGNDDDDDDECIVIDDSEDSQDKTVTSCSNNRKKKRDTIVID